MTEPFLQDADFALHVGHALDVLRELPAESVHCVVTSPPYWGLRDYGTGSWDGGDPDCDHRLPATGGNPKQGPNKGNNNSEATPFKDDCGKCGATRVDQQLGLEPTPGDYVAKMVEVFREVRRVLRRDGTCWLNLGDSYASAWACDRRNVVGSGSLEHGKREDRPNRLVGGLKEKDLVGIPWRVAFALQADGWYLRSDIVWSKPNPMPESVTDRPTKAHEYLFLLTRSPRYYYDADAIREAHSRDWWHENRTHPGNPDRNDGGSVTVRDESAGRNARSVWEIATQPYPDAHFATFPEELPRRCILAGCPEWVCGTCGKPRERIVARNEAEVVPTARRVTATGGAITGGTQRSTLDGSGGWGSQTLGWSDCGHDDYRPGVVLDPFLGSGTTALVARRHGRRSIGIELSPDYARLAARRLQQLSLLAEEAS